MQRDGLREVDLKLDLQTVAAVSEIVVMKATEALANHTRSDHQPNS